MSTLLSIIFAASLTSSDIGEFFTLADWIPDEVASADTPGSDPSSGVGGWYVECQTNAFTDFEAEYDDDGYFEVIGIPLFSEGKWMFDHMHVYVRGSVAPIPYAWGKNSIDGTGEELILHNTFYAVDRAGYEYTINGTYTRETFPSLSGEYRPRSTRLTPEIQAGVLSTFAAYAERQYYAPQGQTNDWNTEIYGPTLNKRKFVYDPFGDVITNIVTNVVWFARTNFGDFPNSNIELHQELYRFWYLRPFAKQVCAYVGLDFEDLSPDYILDDGSMRTITYNGTLYYNVSTNVLATNFNFTATRKDYIVTNAVIETEDEFAYHPTSRHINTRRLVEYDNIYRLADTLLTHCYDSFIYSAPDRPGWINSYENQRFWWSTTNPIIPDSKIIPTFGWSRDPFAKAWSGSSVTFERLVGGQTWWKNLDAISYQPVVELMNTINIGEMSDAAWAENVDRYCSQPTLQMSMDDVITNVYPHADAAAITNDTRRLVSDRLCCMNQVLGLMDRTFQVPSVYYPTNYVYYSFHRDARSHGTATSHLAEWDSGRKQYIVQVDSPISWGGLRFSTNVVSVSTNAYTSYIGTVRHGASETGSATGVTTQAPSTDEEFEGERTFGYRLGETDLRLICNGWADGEWHILFYNYLPNVLDDQSFDLKYSYFKIDSDIFRGWYTVTPTGDVQHVSFDYNYSRHYNYSHPFGSPHLGPHQPGFQSRNTTSKYGMVTATSFGTIDHMSIPHVTNRMYRAKTGEFVGRGGAEVIVSDEADGMNERFQTLYGYNPLNYNQIIPMIASDITESRDSTEITKIYMQAVCYLSSTNTQYACVTISGGRITSINTGTLGTVVSLKYVSDDKSYDRPKSEDHDGMVLNAKIGILTRTDWDWKALKRTDD